MKPPSILSWIVVFFALTLGASTLHGFPTYSRDRDSTNCRACHGDFRAADYRSRSDGQVWGNLHDLHRNIMLRENDPENLVVRCDTCHRRDDEGDLEFFPVRLSRSAGGVGDGIACLGCHGREEDFSESNPDFTRGRGRGAGLRQHHTNSGVGRCKDCHEDADPAQYTPVGENVLPPYYFTPDFLFPNKPTDPCNAFGEENFAGNWEGLDNDGDGIYDVLDSDCKPPFGKITICHVAPGRSAVATTISVNAASLGAHLNHGDLIGDCAAPAQSVDVSPRGRNR